MYEDNGDHVRTQRYESTGEGRPKRLLVGPDEALTLAGEYDGAIDLGSGMLMPFDSPDSFVVRLERAP